MAGLARNMEQCKLAEGGNGHLGWDHGPWHRDSNGGSPLAPHGARLRVRVGLSSPTVASISYRPRRQELHQGAEPNTAWISVHESRARSAGPWPGTGVAVMQQQL